MKLRNQNVLIFGGGSGIGKAIAARLVKDGAKVMIVGRNAEKLKGTCDEINSKNLYYRAFDICNIKSHEKLFAESAEVLGDLNAFVNSSAVALESFGRGYEPWDITEEEWDFQADINYKAAYFLMRNEIDYMLQHGIWGNILNIASNAAYTDIIGGYGAAKEAIIKWTRAFGKKYGHNGIILNGIAPGATLTPMISHYAKDASQSYGRHAIERFIQPEEIAELAYYLMSDCGEIVCGHTVVADGGDNCAY